MYIPTNLRMYRIMGRNRIEPIEYTKIYNKRKEENYEYI